MASDNKKKLALDLATCAEQLSNLVRAQVEASTVRFQERGDGRRTSRVGDILSTRGIDFMIETASRSDTLMIEANIAQLQATMACAPPGRYEPVLAVRYMGEKGASICAEHAVSWFDLSGNADIAVANEKTALFVHVEGRPNQFVRRGRAKNPFSPKRSRIA